MYFSEHRTFIYQIEFRYSNALPKVAIFFPIVNVGWTTYVSTDLMRRLRTRKDQLIVIYNFLFEII